MKTHKQCADCAREGIGPKTVFEFGKHRQSKDGLSSYCKLHNAARATDYYRRNTGKISDYYKERYESLREEKKAAAKEQRLRMPMWKRSLYAARDRATKYAMAFDLTEEWALARWTGCCELTGIEFARTPGQGTNPLSPSIDRIDSSIGYLQGNCRFVLHSLNSFKGTGTDEEMYAIAEALLKARGAAQRNAPN